MANVILFDTQYLESTQDIKIHKTHHNVSSSNHGCHCWEV